MTQPSNILIIISDDHRWFDMGCCGNKDVHTPNLDQLASEGVRFENHYTPTPICAPARMTVYTGLFPVRNGGYPNHSQAYEGTRSVVHYLTEAGYRVGLHGKKHFGPYSVFPFEEVPDIQEFMNCSEEQPFCLVIATNEPHAPWKECLEEFYQPSKIGLAPNLIDTPATRDALSRYYSDVTRLDAKIGDYLKTLEETGKSDDTIVVYTSDHGAQFPGGKWTCYEPGLRIPLIMRWPENIKPGRSTSALTQHADILPTLLDALGVDTSKVSTGRPDAQGTDGFDGASFAALFAEPTGKHRDYVYGVMTQHGTHNGVPYPVRSITDGKFKYIINLLHETAYQNVLTGSADMNHENRYWEEWLSAAETDEKSAFLVERYLQRPKEEFYDLSQDLWEMDNLIEAPEHAEKICELRKSLKEWMEQQGDQGIDTEMAALERQGK